MHRVDSSWKFKTAGTIGCILLVVFGMFPTLPVVQSTYAQPSIHGLNPNVHVQLPPVTSDSSSSSGSSSPSSSAAKTKRDSPVLPTDPDHLALFLEHQLCLAAAAVITQIGHLITSAVNQL
ncbi:MAG: hypothetical protein JWN30_756 [Bacilli bacterium]|nr:hypothetical protein [Bacilli bacterium]